MSKFKRGVPLSKKIKGSLIVLVVVLVFKLSFIGRGSVVSCLRNKAIAVQNKQQYEEMLTKIEKTDAEIALLIHDDEYLIKVAREEYGMQKKDERVIKLIESEDNNNPTGE